MLIGSWQRCLNSVHDQFCVMSGSVSRQLAWIELPFRVLRFDRAFDLVSVIGSNQDYPVAKDLIRSLSAIASASEF